MTGEISEDPAKVVNGNEKLAAAVGGSNFGILVSSIATCLASLAQTFTNKTINATSNTISGLTTAMFAPNVVDRDATFAANSDTRIPSQKAVKTTTAAVVSGDGGVVGPESSTNNGFARWNGTGGGSLKYGAETIALESEVSGTLR